MKIIPLHEAAANLAKYGKQCHRDPILVTVKGLPEFKLVPYKPGDDPILDAAIASNPAFISKEAGPKKGAKMSPAGVLAGLKSRERIDLRMGTRQPKRGKKKLNRDV